MSENPLLKKTLDALVYAPVGFILTATEDLPEMAAKGRDRLELQIRNARVVGQLAVTVGQQRLKQQLDRLGGDRPPTPEQAPEASAPPPASTAPAPEQVNRAIPDYDSLSASQVVRRLDGLDPVDLAAVYDHEAATRGRQTILHRAQQLLGTE